MKETILILIFAFFVIGYFHQYNLRHKAVQKLKKVKEDLKISYDDYARYQKAYIEYYKWLDSHSADKIGYSESTIKLCRKKYKELFVLDLSLDIDE